MFFPEPRGRFVCWRGHGHGPQADLVRSRAWAVIADVPGP